MNQSPENDREPASSTTHDLNRELEHDPHDKVNVATRKSFQISAWFALSCLILTLGYVIFRNVQSGREPGTREETVIAEGMISALSQTKLAYLSNGMHYSVVASASKPVKSPAKLRKSLLGTPTEAADASILEWKKLTSSSLATPGMWRRYAICLFLFNRPGGMSAFQHIADAPKTPVPGEKATEREKRKYKTLQEASHPISVSEELELWTSIYDSKKVDPARVPELSAKVSKLNLGWFENITLANLNQKASRFAAARQAARVALSSCKSLNSLNSFQIGMAIFGFFLLFAYALFTVIMKLTDMSTKRVSPPVVHSYHSTFDGIPGMEGLQQTTGKPTATQNSSAESKVASFFSYRTLTIGFLVYYLAFLLIAYPIRIFSPLFVHLSDSSLHRLSLVLGLILYVPVVALTLWSLQVMSEREKNRKVRMREVWRGLGFRFDQVGRDFATAAAGYVMLYPLIAIAGFLSIWIFETLLRRYHFFTPINPAEIESIISVSLLDQILLGLQAVVAAPIVEEMMFRGLLMKGLRARWGLALAAIVSSAIFALSHNTLPNGFLTLWTIGMGLCCGYTQNGKNSILPNIFMHAIHNGLITLMMAFVFSK